jgi:hypothetical protein
MSAPAYSSANVAKAIERVPRMGSTEIEELGARAASRGFEELRDACALELSLRGPARIAGEDAPLHDDWRREVEPLGLAQTIEYAFGLAAPATEAETSIVRLIAETPGITHAALGAAYGKRDLSLVMGHFVNDRHGCFRKWLADEEDQSGVLFRKDRSGRSVRYWLKPETETAFRQIGLIGAVEPGA